VDSDVRHLVLLLPAAVNGLRPAPPIAGRTEGDEETGAASAVCRMSGTMVGK